MLQPQQRLRSTGTHTVWWMNDHAAVPALGAALAAWRDTLATITTRDLSLASPNPGWDVAHVINHTIATTRKFTAFASGATDRPRTPTRDFLGADHRAAFNDTADQALAAWRDADLERMCHLPFGTFTAEVAAGINLFDLLAHGWDIHQATGATFTCPPSAWAAGLNAAQRVLGEQRDPHHYAPELTTPARAPAQLRLLRYLGRAANRPALGPEVVDQCSPLSPPKTQHRPTRISRVPHSDAPIDGRHLDARTTLVSAAAALPPGRRHLDACAALSPAVTALAPDSRHFDALAALVCAVATSSPPRLGEIPFGHISDTSCSISVRESAGERAASRMRSKAVE